MGQRGIDRNTVGKGYGQGDDRRRAGDCLILMPDGDAKNNPEMIDNILPFEKMTVGKAVCLSPSFSSKQMTKKNKTPERTSLYRIYYGHNHEKRKKRN